MKRITVICILVFPLVCMPLFSDGLHFEPVGGEEVQELLISSVIQDKSGFIWIGTDDGLFRYDGNEVIPFRYDHKNPLTISHNYINTIVGDGADSLWIGTAGGGICRLNLKTGICDRFIIDKKKNSSGNFATQLFHAKNGDLFLGTYNGLYVFDLRRETFDPVMIGAEGEIVRVRGMVEWDDVLVIGTSAGLRFVRLSDRILLDPGNFIESENKIFVYSMMKTDDGKLMIGDDQRVHLFDPVRKKISDIEESMNFSFPFDKAVFYSIVQQGDSLFFSTSRGLIRLKPGGGPEWFLKDKGVTVSFFDRSGVLWVGTIREGVKKFSPFMNRFPDRDMVSSFYEKEKVSVLSFEEDEKYFWAGTYSRGLYRIDKENGSYEKVQIPSWNNENTREDHSIMSLLTDGEGVLWIGTTRGLHFLNRSSGKARFGVYTSDGDSEIVLSANAVNCLFRDSKGLMWVGTPEGLNRIDTRSGTVRYFNSKKGSESPLNSSWITAINEDFLGNIWIGGLNGLNKYDPVSGEFTGYSADPANKFSISFNDITDIMIDKEGRVWIGTWSGGLNLYQQGTDSFRTFTIKNGMINNTVSGIVDGIGNNIWISTMRGITEYDLASDTFKNYSGVDGLKTLNFHYRARFKTRSGKIYFFGNRDVTIIGNGTRELNRFVPETVITSLSVNGKNERKNRFLDVNREKFTYSYKDKNFQLGFASLDYNIPEKNRYAYRIEPLDAENEWHDLGTENKLIFFSLPEGDNRIHVKGTNSEGVWNDDPAYVDIRIIPPFRHTIWFKMIIVFFSLSILFVLYRLRLRTMIRKMAYSARVDYFCGKYNISSREKEVLALLIGGKNNKEIEDLLFISQNTVRNHIYNIYQKLGVNSRVQLLKLFDGMPSEEPEGDRS